MMLGIRQVRIPATTSAVTDVRAAWAAPAVSLTAFDGASLVREGEGLPEARPRLSERARAAMRLRHFSPRTEEANLAWMRRYYEFHGRRDPSTLGPEHVTAFLSALATCRRVAASTQNQALAALLFLYRDVLGIELPWLDDLVHARSPWRLRVVLTRDEVRAVLAHLEGVPCLMATLLYGCGLRLPECCRLRVKDVDFGRNQITVRRGKGDKDRVTMLPASLKAELGAHLERVRAQHARDLTRGAGWVELPGSLAQKLPSAGRDWAWQWVFPATRIYVERGSGERRRATTCTRPSCSAPFAAPSSPRVSPSARPATRCVTRSPRTSSRTGATSAPFRSSSATRTSPRR